MRINHNITALNTYRQLTTNNSNTQKSLEKLSSGFRINRAGDDAAGLAISEKMRGQIRGLDQASRNAQDGISFIQTAEGNMNEVHSILQRMKELATQASNGTYTDKNREDIQKEINQLTSEVNRIGNTAEFNSMKVCNGDLSEVFDTGKVKITASTGTYSAAFAEGVTWTGLSGDIPVISDGTTNNQVKFSDPADSEFDWTKVNTTKTATLKVSRSGNDLLIDIQATDTDGDIMTINADKAAYDTTSKKFTYAANGVKFEISSSEFEKFTDGASMNINLADYDHGAPKTTVNFATTTVGTRSEYSQTLKAAGTTNGAFAVAADHISVNSASADYIEGVAGIKITGTGLNAANGTYKIELLDNTGKAIVTEDFTNAAATSEINYNRNGIKFKWTVNDAATVSISKKFDYTTTKVTEDRSCTFQIGANEHQSMSMSVADIRSAALKITGTGAGFSAVKNVTDGTNNTAVENALNVTSIPDAAKAITVFDNAIATVSGERAKLGAVQNRLEHTILNLGTSSENLSAAESRIRDVDMAKEMMEFTKNNILTQAAQAMLAQANQQPQGVLQLLR